MVLASAVKWAEMAADYERARNSKIFFCSSLGPSCGHLIAPMQYFFRPTQWHPELVICHGPKSTYFGLISKISPYDPVLSPRPLLLGPGTSPGWVLLILEPYSYFTKYMGVLISGSLASSTLNHFMTFYHK